VAFAVQPRRWAENESAVPPTPLKR
jgi:hypothetical protein